MSISPWHFGNTTVRNPLRIRDGLIVLKNSVFNGNLIGKVNETLFADELDRSGVIVIANKARDYSDLGRKWRAVFSQLGFITHKFSRNVASNDEDLTIRAVLNQSSSFRLTGKPYEITPNGLRLINADSLSQQQECLLRSLLAYEIPSIIEPANGNETFNPFIFILQVLRRLSQMDDNRGLSYSEMIIVQFCRKHEQLDEAIEKIIVHRLNRDNAYRRVGKRAVDKQLLNALSINSGILSDTVKTYTDVNFRYPRLTGLVSLIGKRLVLSDKKLPVIEAILDNPPKALGIDNETEYLMRLWNGAELPTDNEIGVMSEIRRFQGLLDDVGIDSSIYGEIPIGGSVADLNHFRLGLEEMYQKHLERTYAQNQSYDEQISETIAYLKLLDKQQINTEEYDIEIDDEPSYLEWSVWRAFLSINNLINEPHECRRFKIDQDFFPLGCAPGGGPDMIFEFRDYVLVVEVTLTTSSRQEAAEGEPVRRHVAKEKTKYASSAGKPVYGLFVARTIDNNTAETFRIGVWYNGDEPDFINIVPITLKQFIKVMEHFLITRFDNSYFRRVLDNCLIPRNAHAPAWKREIDKAIQLFIS